MTGTKWPVWIIFS